TTAIQDYGFRVSPRVLERNDVPFIRTRLARNDNRGTSSKRPAEPVVERERAAAAHEKEQGAGGPHQRVFHALRVPEISADAPALHVRDQQKEKDGQRGGAREQARRQQGPGDELRRRDQRRPELARRIAPS